SLLKLLDWLVEHKAWKVADAVEQRFADRFQQQPLLMYLLADVRKKQGQDEQAEQTASKALEATGNNAYEHYKVARELQQRGLFDWTLREYRRAIELGPAPNPLVTFASQSAMAELLHDQQRHLEGAEVLKPAVEELEKNAEHRQSVRDRLGREL